MVDDDSELGEELPAGATANPGTGGDIVAAGRPDGRRLRWLAVLLVPVVLLMLGFGGDRAMHADQVLRGVSVGDVPLAGHDRAGARQAIEQLEAELRELPLAIQVRDQTFELKPSEVDFGFAVDDMVDEAMRAGREGALPSQLGWWLGSFGDGHPLDPRPTIDEAKLRALLAVWASSAIDDPPFEGSIEVEDGKPVARAPRSGWVVDDERAVAALASALTSRERRPLEVPLTERAPARDSSAVDAALKDAVELHAAPITLIGVLPPDAQNDGDKKAKKKKKKKKKKGDEADEADEPRTERFAFMPVALAAALRSRLVDGGVQIYLEPTALEPALALARQKLERPPVDATFAVSKRDEVSVVASRAGRVIDAAKVASVLLQAAHTPSREAAFPVEDGARPEMETQDVEALAVVGLVSKFTTMHPCCRPRVKNIHRIAELIDGVIVKPGETFSINGHVGERTAAKGFVPAPTIVHGEMKDTIGGGISQFATTFFNAAFYGGYGIVERQPHSYYFERYPMGHEATLSFPKPDVIITNDTEAGLLIKVKTTPTSITVKFYGDNSGRKVKRKKSRVFDVTDPPIEYIADSSLEPDEEKVKARGRVGWSLTVSRVITYPDDTTKKEGRKVTYKPRVRKLRVHPCKVPEGEDGHTGEPCPEPEDLDELEQEMPVPDELEEVPVDAVEAAPEH